MRVKKLIKVAILGLIILLVLLVSIAVYYASDFRSPADEIIRQQLAGKIQLDTVIFKGLPRRYLIRKNNSAKPLLCFIQGAPMILLDFIKYIEDSTLSSQYTIIVPERLGYGPSENDEAEEDIRVQAQHITSLILKAADNNQQVVILSHSYGGPIGALTSKYLGDRVNGHVMLAPVIDPDHEKMFWFSKLPILFPFRHFMSQALKTAAIEKSSHSSSLRLIKDEFDDIHSPTIHFHGTDDFLAPIENIPFVRAHFDTQYLKQVIIPGGNHFMDFTLVRNELVRLSQ